MQKWVRVLSSIGHRKMESTEGRFLFLKRLRYYLKRNIWYTYLMLLSMKYSYLFGTLLFFIPWVIIYWKRKDLRQEMWVLSVLVGGVSVLTSYTWWTDNWWDPQTITGTKVGIEDFLLGFANGGVAAAIYSFLTGKIYFSKSSGSRNLEAVLVPGLMFVVIALLHGYFEINTFYSLSVAMFISGIYFLVLRPDLFKMSIMSGLLMALLSLPVYWFSELISPGVIEASW